MPQIKDHFEGRRRGSLNRRRLLASFRRAIRSFQADLLQGTAKPLHVARLAHRLYVAGKGGKHPSVHAFERRIYGKAADTRITDLIPKPDPRRFQSVFEKALRELSTEKTARGLRPRAVARRAHALFIFGATDGEKVPSAETFRKMASGRRAHPEIVRLLGSFGVRSPARGREKSKSAEKRCPSPFREKLNRRDVLEAFGGALRELATEKNFSRLRPRTVAVRAREIHRRGSVETFRKFATGRRALPEVVALLRAAGVTATARVRLDRERLRTVFHEAVRRFEAGVFKGNVTPTRIARRAYDLYASATPADASRPSRHTFQRLIYGKVADPEIIELIRPVVKGKG